MYRSLNDCPSVTPLLAKPSLDCEVNVSPVFKIESVYLERRDAILISKQQFVITMRDEFLDPQILQVHTAITENTNIHQQVHNIFYNN